MGFLGAMWLLEAAHVLPETEAKLLGAGKLPGQSCMLLGLIESYPGAWRVPQSRDERFYKIFLRLLFLDGSRVSRISFFKYS
jgi:hypothetical protein